MIKNPNNEKKIPKLLNLVSGIFSMILTIFLILVGKMAKNSPSKNSNNPKAVMRSFIERIKES